LRIAVEKGQDVTYSQTSRCAGRATLSLLERLYQIEQDDIKSALLGLESSKGTYKLGKQGTKLTN
jgi:hypothetical protein